MAQRNPLNERYNDDSRSGKTRKSAASAKPSSTRASTVRDPAPKSKKQKKKEAEERNRREMEKRNALPGKAAYESTPEYKKLRRMWAITLGGGVAMVLLAFVAVQYNLDSWIYITTIVLGYGLVIAAFVIDFAKIRKGRKAYYAVPDNSKEARAAQKKARAEARAQEKEAKEKAEAGEVEEEEPKGLLARFRKPKAEESPEESSEEE